MNALYESARNLIGIVGTIVVLWHGAWSRSYYELVALVVGIWLGMWLRDITLHLHR